MPGLDPGIHAAKGGFATMDRQVKPGDDVAEPMSSLCLCASVVNFFYAPFTGRTPRIWEMA